MACSCVTRPRTCIARCHMQHRKLATMRGFSVLLPFVLALCAANVVPVWSLPKVGGSNTRECRAAVRLHPENRANPFSILRILLLLPANVCELYCTNFVLEAQTRAMLPRSCTGMSCLSCGRTLAASTCCVKPLSPQARLLLWSSQHQQTCRNLQPIARHGWLRTCTCR